jgi:hypothetical protein
MVDLWQSCKFYFFEIFGIPHLTIPTVEQFSDVLEWNIFLPSDYEAFKATASDYFALLFNKENFGAYWAMIGEGLGNISRIIVIILPSVLLVIALIKGSTRERIITITKTLCRYVFSSL